MFLTRVVPRCPYGWRSTRREWERTGLVIDRVGIGVTWYELWFLSTTETANIMFLPKYGYHVSFIQVGSDNGRVLFKECQIGVFFSNHETISAFFQITQRI